jgi:hypothetical protein
MVHHDEVRIIYGMQRLPTMSTLMNVRQKNQPNESQNHSFISIGPE